MKSIQALIIFSLLCCSAYAEEFITRSALQGKVSLSTPKRFSPMAKEVIELKYPSSRRPTEVLSNPKGSVTLAFNHTNDVMAPNQVQEAHESISKMFHNLYPSATWIRDETIVKDGHNFIVLELITPALDTKIHNIMYGTSVDNRFLLVAFNSTVVESKKWIPIGKKIMESLSLR